jgi:hypothetical protein
VRAASGREFYKCGKELHEDDGYAALYSIYPGLRLLPSALLLAVTLCTASAGRPSCALEALGTRNTGAPGWEFATPLQADHDCGARGATSLDGFNRPRCSSSRCIGDTRKLMASYPHFGSNVSPPSPPLLRLAIHERRASPR